MFFSENQQLVSLTLCTVFPLSFYWFQPRFRFVFLAVYFFGVWFLCVLEFSVCFYIASMISLQFFFFLYRQLSAMNLPLLYGIRLERLYNSFSIKYSKSFIYFLISVWPVFHSFHFYEIVNFLLLLIYNFNLWWSDIGC